MFVLIISNGSGAQRRTEPQLELNKSKRETKTKMDSGDGMCVQDGAEPAALPSSSDHPCLKLDDCLKSGEKSSRLVTQPSAPNDKNTTEEEELHSSSGNGESDDYDEDEDVVLLLSDEREDESHYITTHEIQLSELSDHESDLGMGSSTSWDLEDDTQVYSFVDNTTFDGDGGAEERGDDHQPRPQGKAAAVSTLHESDPCDRTRFTSADESGSKAQQQQQCSSNAGGQIHLSIRTTSRAINDPSNIQNQENILYHAMRSGEVSRYVLGGVDGGAETSCDRAKCFIAAPGCLHFGRKLRGKEFSEHSSGTSSAVSDLDDADKEVRTLTARTFKSLAYPYFDAFNFSTSSESSASENGRGINRLSTFVDLKYGNVNLSQGLDQSLVSHQNPLASFQNVDGRGYQGIGLKSVNPPTGKIFTLKADPHGATSSTKKIELMGKFGQGHGGVIRLTETLNFRCNVKSGVSGGERHANFTQDASGSSSRDEVTNTLPSSLRRGARLPCPTTMEDTHKKAIFASSLIKNVISKKMQFEQERKMERGEISEPHQRTSPSCAPQDSDRGKGSRELHRQGSKFSKESSSYGQVCVDEVGDVVDSGCDSRRLEAAAPTLETNIDPAEEAAIEPKKGSLEAAKSTLRHSQNSAFRCWKDKELEFQKGHQNGQSRVDKSPTADRREGEEDRNSPSCGKLTKMSHLFVPNIQLMSTKEDGEQQRSGTHSSCGDAEGRKLCSDSTLYVTGSRNANTSKSPEIKINLRNVRDNKTEPFGISTLRTPNIGCHTATLTRMDEYKCQALASARKGESSDKVPHFMVRDIRDNKAKLQTPIHQVRDVRKLVKSSYHFVSLDNKESRSNIDNQVEQKKQVPHRNPNSVSPIVIKCQSVNTNSNDKQSRTHTELDADGSSPEDAKDAPPQRTAGRVSTGNSTKGDLLVITESIAAPNRLDKTSDISDKRNESKMTNQVALEKLQAAVKTMEQLYVFDRNEWKRKSEPHPLTDSHVLSLIASKEDGGPEEEGATGSNRDKTPPAAVASLGTDTFSRPEDKLLQSTEAAVTTESKNPVSLSSRSVSPKTANENTVSEAPFRSKGFVSQSPKTLTSLKSSPVKPSVSEEPGSKDSDRFTREISSTAAENENYLTIPVKSHISSNKQASSVDKPSSTTQTHPATPSGQGASCTRDDEDHSSTPKYSSIAMETCSPEIPSATIYHSLPLAMSTNQPQVYCFSPAITPSPTLDPFQATQRKMLLDPTTGHYYLVDTPVQPANKRLFDPETGQYVDVPLPQPATPPVPLQIPLALSPGAYGRTYMIYPGFMPAPSLIPARTLVQSQMLVQLEEASEEKAMPQQTEGLYMESPFYMTTAKSPQTAPGSQQQAPVSKPLQAVPSVKQPLISITSQQGPRIIAPPSFDGTTMSFVVEHR